MFRARGLLVNVRVNKKRWLCNHLSCMIALRAFFHRPESPIFVMSRHLYLDVSPPPYTSSRDSLDKSVFRKTLNVLGARVQPEKTGALLKAPELRKFVVFPFHRV